MKFCRTLAFGAVALLAAHAANATTYYDTMSNQNLQPSIQHTRMANSFYAATPDFTAVQLLLSSDDAYDNGSASVYVVASDNTGSPDLAVLTDSSATTGQKIGTIYDFSFSAVPSPVTLFMSAPTTWSAGTYWVVLVLDDYSSIGWFQNGAGGDGQSIYFWDSGSPAYKAEISEADPSFAMIVDTPEPGTLTILGAGLATLGFIRRRPAK